MTGQPCTAASLCNFLLLAMRFVSRIVILAARLGYRKPMREWWAHNQKKRIAQGGK